MSLVEDTTPTTSEVPPLSEDSDFSAENAPIAFEYYCYDIEADTPQFNYHGPKIMIPEQELPITVLLIQLILYAVKDSFEYFLTQAQMSL
jgi:hypothetical protein